MNILIYIPGLTQEHGGIRQYAIGLLKLLAGDTANDYFIYNNSGDPEILNAIANYPHLQRVQDLDVIVPKKNYITRKITGAKNRLARKFKIGKESIKLSFIDTLCAQFKIDIIHCPYQYIPHTQKAKLITTLHDVQEIHFPEFFTAEIRAYRANAYLDFLRRAHLIIVSYDHVKRDLIKYFNVEAEKIEILLLDINKLWFDGFSERDITDISFLAIPKKFLLYPANTWKHKNHLKLIEAISIAKDKHNVIINLICTGDKNEHYTEIEKLVDRLNIREQIFFTGIVEEKKLYTLYKLCRGVVIPTTYEAGSFPLCESILLNVPVVCSNVTSLPETIGSEEFLFDPFNTDSIVASMIRLWKDDVFRKRNFEHIKQQANVIRKNNSLPKLISLYSTINGD